MVIKHRHSNGASSFGFISAIAALGILNGCVTSFIGNPEIVKQNNLKLTKYDQGTLSDHDEVSRDDQLRRLWRDKPQYVALIAAKHVKTIRIVSIAAPKYPYWEAWAKKRAEVSISFIVGVDGKVEDARVYESSDARFDQSALDAIRKFVFIPAEGRSGDPEPAIEVQPFQFAALSKH